MNIKSKNLHLHIAYWIFALLVLIRAFGFSWEDKVNAFYFVGMIFLIVIGTSYFFNYVLVPKFYYTKRYGRFAFYTFCMAIISFYLEMLVLLFSYIYLADLNYLGLDSDAAQPMLLAIVLYFLVLFGGFLLMITQINENRQVIQQLVDEKEKMKKSFLEIMSNRKICKIPCEEIIYIESLSNYVKIITINKEISSKEKISRLSEKLPDSFLRIHRSFIINTERIKERSLDEVLVEDVRLNIGRTYRKEVKELLNKRA
ncbi:LytR/AlgR family response regulator transcription factor [Marinifilum sp. D737]|uniref:LytR/AlgR family response regulator transcription factor n=1 Tax=Marinifilum sp. D737 TaxID=2969628 RepID=UPI00227632E0|nr:LytTR family DNA-binding domain-containing protein [Marinifilum sp. D737]MCY1635821.1 LytTR family transcriptional regulator [Marinifilum sp. D737]